MLTRLDSDKWTSDCMSPVIILTGGPARTTDRGPGPEAPEAPNGVLGPR